MANDTYTIEPNDLNDLPEPLTIDLGILKEAKHESYGIAPNLRSWAVLKLITDEEVTVDLGNDYQSAEALAAAFHTFLKDLEEDRKSKEEPATD